MSSSLRIALTADLHWGSRHPAGDLATRRLVDALNREPPDVLIVAGDIGTVEHFDECLALFDGIDCRKALVPGNHDIWVAENDARGDSLTVYRQHLPTVSAAHGFHYLDGGPMLLPEADLVLVGSINWYDYSWSIDRLRQQLPDCDAWLKQKRFVRGRHNDGKFVRWPLDDVRFTAEVVSKLGTDLESALGQVGRAVVVVHHPPWYGLNYPAAADNSSPPIDRLLWEAFSGNRSMEALLERFADQVPLAFCGHTHFARESHLGPIHGYNIGGDYHFKRLLRLDWPAGTVTAEDFHAEDV
jgi:3',5'-cyclic AMP phosphodiesterase CpdA